MTTALSSREAECTLIGAAIVRPATMSDVVGLTPAHFHDPRHQAIWHAIQLLERDEEPVDRITIADRMVQAHTFELLKPHGGRAYLDEIVANIATFENLEYHAKQLRRLARRRAIGSWSAQVLAESRDESLDSEEFLESFERGAQAALTTDEVEGGPLKIEPVLHDLRDDIEKRIEATKNKTQETRMTGIPTGFARYDEMTQGLHPGELTIIAARPSMGKTALALNEIAHICSVPVTPVLFFSLEMRNRAQVERMLSKHSRVPSQLIRSGALERSDMGAITSSVSAMSVWPLELDERARIDVATIRSTARNWHARIAKKYPGKVGVIFVDYVGLILGPPGSHRWEPNRTREIAAIVLSLKQLARELAVPVVVLSQLNRSLESRSDKRPIMSDLKESGAIEEHADTIAFLYREFVYSKKHEDKELAELIIGKQRNGPTGTVDLRWLAKIQSFVDSVGDEAPPKKSAFRKTSAARHPYAPDGDDD